jgi:hypothetical protein
LKIIPIYQAQANSRLKQVKTILKRNKLELDFDFFFQLFEEVLKNRQNKLDKLGIFASSKRKEDSRMQI